MVYHPYHLGIPHPKGKQGWLGVAKTFTLTHLEGQDQTPHGLRDPAWEAGHKNRQNQKSEVTHFNTLSRRGKEDSKDSMWAHPKGISQPLCPPDIRVCLPDTVSLSQVW